MTAGLKIPRPWTEMFDERQRKEIEFCRNYAINYKHGALGHNVMMIMAQMADLLDTLQQDSELFIDKNNGFVWSIRCEVVKTRKEWLDYLDVLVGDIGSLLRQRENL